MNTATRQAVLSGIDFLLTTEKYTPNDNDWNSAIKTATKKLNEIIQDRDIIENWYDITWDLDLFTYEYWREATIHPDELIFIPSLNVRMFVFSIALYLHNLTYFAGNNKLTIEGAIIVAMNLVKK